MNRFGRSGDLGDIIYALATLMAAGDGVINASDDAVPSPAVSG